ncbi:MAG TPA: SDR family oxidoreductase [Myxococcales bacterium]|nr:SDR family oxidoreductase [Myxococcales bacterium]
MRERKAFIVTGSSTGVGAATALLLAKEGAGVVVNFSRDPAPAEGVAHACIAAGGDAVVVRADVSDDAACQVLAGAALARWQRLDGLVNNAATTKFAPMRNLDALSADDFQRIYSVNLIGPYQMVRACETALRASRGAVVNVSSIAGSMGIGSSYAYACSKGALMTLTLALARSLAPEIRVNAVLPGFTETRWLRQGLGESYDRARASYCERSALGTTLQPEEVAASIVALLHAAKVTGQLHTVDAGRGLGTP